MSKAITRDVATSATATVFLVMGISGVMMFLHFNDMLVKELHEILGLVFVGAVVLHVMVNWKSMKNYFSKKIFISIAIITIIVSGLFIFEAANKGENPKVVLIEKVINAPLADSLKLLNGSYDSAILKLTEQNIDIKGAKNIEEIAKINKTSPFRIVSIITK